MSLKSCVSKAGKLLTHESREQLFDLADRLQASGLSPVSAEKLAVRQLRAQLEALKAQIEEGASAGEITQSNQRTLERVHEFEMSTRAPWAKTSAKFTPEDSVANLLIADFNGGHGQEKWLQAVTGLVEQYPNYREAATAKTPAQKLERMVRQMVDNLVWLHDQVPADTRERSKLWYDGANAIAKRWAKRYDLSEPQVAGILAVLSPQKDWFMNVSLANRVIEIFNDRQAFHWSKEMDATGDRIFAGDAYREDLDEIRGETLQDIDDEYLRAMWVRIYDQAHNPRSFMIVSPEGDFVAEARTKQDAPANVAWGSIPTIAKALRIAESGSAETISNALGRKHKVRNFYNNILVPNSPNGHVTIDTHAVAAALLRALSGNSAEVMHNFGGPKSAHAGLEGTYPLYEEAYRRAAEQRGLLPREMQSITWEAVRGLFAPSFKANASKVDSVDQAWVQFKKGRLSHANTQQQIIGLAGGIEQPSWLGRNPGAYEEDGSTTDEGDLAEDVVSGRGAGSAARGARSGDSGGAEVQRSTDRTDLAEHRGALRASPYAGREGHDRQDVLRVFSLAPELREQLQAIGVATPDLLETSDAKRFQAAIASSKDGNKFAAAVYVYPEEDYRGMRLFLTEDDKAGFALKGDDIVSVFRVGSNHKRVTDAMLPLAVQLGGRRLDAFDTVLPVLYAPHGFRATGRMHWNDEYAPDGWDKKTFAGFNKGEPDVVFMAYDPAYAGIYSRDDGKVFGDYDAAVDEQRRKAAEWGDSEDDGSTEGRDPSEGVTRSKARDVKRGTEEEARAQGFTLKAYRGVSQAKPFNDTGSTWLATSKEVAEAYAEEVMGYDDPAVLTVMVKPDDLPRHDASRLTDDQREELQADSFGNPQAIGIYDRSDDHPLGGSRKVTVIHAPKDAVFVVDEGITRSTVRPGMPEFKQWFGKSKVVDGDGAPMAVYHGTKQSFTSFDRAKNGAASGNSGFFGDGFYFTPSKGVADGYAGNWSSNASKRGTVMTAYLSIRKPLQLSEDENGFKRALRASQKRLLALDGWTDAEREILSSGDVETISEATMQIGGPRFREVVESNGFDGVYVDHSVGSMNAPEWVAFHPEQIKRAAETDDITRSATRNEDGTLRMSNAAVSKSFKSMVLRSKDDMLHILKEWRGAELNEDEDQIVEYPGRDGFYSRGKDGGAYRVSKREFFDWLASDAPFDPKQFGEIDQEWRDEIEGLRAHLPDAGDVKQSAAREVNSQGELTEIDPREEDITRSASRDDAQMAVDEELFDEDAPGFFRAKLAAANRALGKFGYEGFEAYNGSSAEILDEDGNTVTLRSIKDPQARAAAQAFLRIDRESIRAESGHRPDFTKLGVDDGFGSVKFSKPRPAFYSQLELALDNVPAKLSTMAAPQWKLWLDANAAKHEAEDDVKESGILDHLKSLGRAKVSAEDLVKYLRADGVDGDVLREADDDASTLPIPARFGGLPTASMLYHGGRMDGATDKQSLTVNGTAGVSYTRSPMEALEYASHSRGDVFARRTDGLRIYSGGKSDLDAAVKRSDFDALASDGYDGVDLRAITGGGYNEVVLWGDAASPALRADAAPVADGYGLTSKLQTVEGGTPLFSSVRDMNAGFGYKVADWMDSSKKVSWWDKSVGTPYHLAQKHPMFKRVFDALQNSISDVSKYATRAADMAPSILPKLENMKDLFKSPLSAEDVEKLADPIFKGTLTYTRDADGNPVEAESVGDAGIVWTTEELTNMWGLDERQRGLYREFRKATNKSIADLAITNMVRYAGADAEGVRGRALEQTNVQAAASVLADHLAELAATDPRRANTLQNAARVIKEMADDARGLMAKGYAPLSRFGDYAVYAPGIGEHGFFEMFENERDANRRKRQLQAEFPREEVSVGTIAKEVHQLFKGITPETLALFGESLGLEESASDQQSQVFQEYLRLAKSTRSALKHLIERKGVEGYSNDVGRVLASFVYSNGRQAAQNLNASEVTKGLYDLKESKQGDLFDHAMKLANYAQNPQEEAQALRGLTFLSFIGWNVASAAVNLTQSATTTWPTLGMHFGIGKAGKAMASALGVMKNGAGADRDLEHALKRAALDGITDPNETHYLQGQAQGSGTLKSGDGTKLGDTLAKMSNGMSKLLFVGGKAFALAEVMNRKVAFISAFSLARERGDADPYAFAVRIVDDTQFLQNKANNPVWARGPVGATVFQFKKFAVAYLENLQRMWGHGPEGKIAVAQSLAIMFFLAGLGGFPGADDLDDLIDGVMQRVFNKSFASKQAKKEFFAGILGDAGADFVLNGFSALPGVPIDVSGRLGMGNLLPASGLAVVKQNYGNDVKELFGAAGSMAGRALEGANAVTKGDVAGAVGGVLPVAAANVVKAVDMIQRGAYTDIKGRKVIDTTVAEAVMKGIGFQPSSVKNVQDATRTQQELIALNKQRETEIADLWARGRIERKPELVDKAKQQLKEWNVENPTSPIELNSAQVNKRVVEANMSKAQRLTKTAPKEIRASVKAELKRDGVE